MVAELKALQPGSDTKAISLYDVFSKVETRSLDPVGAFWVFKTLREFCRSGVIRDEATRTRVNTLNEELVKMGVERRARAVP